MNFTLWQPEASLETYVCQRTPWAGEKRERGPRNDGYNRGIASSTQLERDGSKLLKGDVYIMPPLPPREVLRANIQAHSETKII